MSFIICSFFTLDTPYQQVAHDYLLSSLKKVNVKSDIRGVQSLGNWQKNTSYKPQFISEILEKHTENIVFCDADAEILSYPDLFDNIPDEFNFAAHILDRRSWYGVEYSEEQSKELLSGTLFIRNNTESRAIVHEWATTVKMFSQIWEQQVLAKVLKNNNVKVFELPVEYCWIRSLPDGRDPLIKPNGPIIIQHNQVSRTLRNKVK
jgi:Nucleotide-diphospho-sugar transferase